MTSAEFETLSKRLFTAMPDLWEWLASNSPDPKGTQATWRDCLRDCTLVECLHVLDDWIMGRRPAPKAYERADVARMLRQSVMFDRTKARERQRTEGQASEFRRTRRDDYAPLAQHLPALGTIFAEGRELRRRLVDGEIDSGEYESGKAALLARVK